MAKSPITTHILDIALGKPAAGVNVSLSKKGSDGFQALGSGITDNDGRIADLLPVTHKLEQGIYRLEFEVEEYFSKAARPSFYPHIVICFEIKAVDEHYHVPLLLSPFGYSTYRGS